MRHILLEETSGVTIQGARFRSIELREADNTRLLQNVMGGTPGHRVYDQIIFMPDESNNVEIRENDIGWTKADDSGNTGYGCRCYGTLNNLRFVGNRVHDIAADGFQGVGGRNVLIDRNEIGPVGAQPRILRALRQHPDNRQWPQPADHQQLDPRTGLLRRRDHRELRDDITSTAARRTRCSTKTT